MSKKKDLILKKIDGIITDNAVDDLRNAILSHGLTPDKIAEYIKEMMHWETIKIDKNGVVHESLDGQLRYKAIELWHKIMCLEKKGSGKEIHNHLHLGDVSDEALLELERKANKIREIKEISKD